LRQVLPDAGAIPERQEDHSMKFLKEPLLHFMLIGAAFFALYAWLNPGALQSERRIVIDEGRINSLAESFERTWNREPTQRELANLVDEFALDEIYYRRALSMGLDQNDAVVRRRLRQKLEFLASSAATVVQPGDVELQGYLEQNADQYRRPDRYSFSQVYINATRSSAELEQRLEEVEEALKKGESVTGDSSLIATGFDDISAFQIDNTLGSGFTAQLDGLPLNEWSAPLRSGLGFHFVNLYKREPGALPSLDEIRDVVLRDWSYEKEATVRKAIEQELLAAYDIAVEWPKQSGAR
jgi:parvulin-like peptidyl-prolyl isomerase